MLTSGFILVLMMSGFLLGAAFPLVEALLQIPLHSPPDLPGHTGGSLWDFRGFLSFTGAF